MKNKKIITVLSAVMLVFTMSIPVSAYSSASSGSFTAEEVNGSGYKVFMFNNNGTYSTANFNISSWEGKGNVIVDCYCGASSYPKTFTSTGSKTWYDFPNGMSGYWGMDAINSSVSKTRTITGNYSVT